MKLLFVLRSKAHKPFGAGYDKNVIFMQHFFVLCCFASRATTREIDDNVER